MEKLKEELVRMDAGARFLRYRSVQKELGLTAEQRDDAYRLANEMMDREMDARQNGTGTLPPGAVSEAERNREFLTPAQRNRLQQIDYQAAGISAFFRSEVRAAVGLTAEQIDRLRALEREMESQRPPAGEPGKRPPAARKDQWAAVKAAYLNRALDLLTSDQKKIWRELSGDPATLKL
jgi:hypothetical protein